MKDTYSVCQIGLGPIGLKTTVILAERPNLKIKSAVDIDKSKRGKDLGTLAGLGELGVKVTDSLEEALGRDKIDIVVLTTCSKVEQIYPQLQKIVPYGVNVVTTCEELSYSWVTKPDISSKVNELAKAHGVSILATGVNPGFLMDYLPLALSGVCKDVESVTVERIQDATPRRVPFQKKIGAGLTAEEFDEKVKAGIIKHVGLTESMHMIASKMGWVLDRTEEDISPIIADSNHTTPGVSVTKGNVAGVQQIGRGIVGGVERISMIFRASIGEKDPRDSVDIKGTPNVHSVIPGGINGDIATCAIIVNAIPVVVEARAGLRTMSDIETIAFFD